MKPTKRDKLDNCHAAYLAQKEGRRPRPRAKDGSVPTHPVVPVPDLPEAEVLAQCLKWLKARRVFCDRHDCGEGPDRVRFGIKGAGDIIGILSGSYTGMGACDVGRHFEIECKRGKGGRLSRDQQRRMERVREAGGVYEVVHGIPELEHYMRGLI